MPPSPSGRYHPAGPSSSAYPSGQRGWSSDEFANMSNGQDPDPQSSFNAPSMSWYTKEQKQRLDDMYFSYQDEDPRALAGTSDAAQQQPQSEPQNRNQHPRPRSWGTFPTDDPSDQASQRRAAQFSASQQSRPLEESDATLDMKMKKPERRINEEARQKAILDEARLTFAKLDQVEREQRNGIQVFPHAPMSRPRGNGPGFQAGTGTGFERLASLVEGGPSAASSSSAGNTGFSSSRGFASTLQPNGDASSRPGLQARTGTRFERLLSLVEGGPSAGSSSSAGNTGFSSPRGFASTPQPNGDALPRPASQERSTVLHRLPPVLGPQQPPSLASYQNVFGNSGHQPFPQYSSPYSKVFGNAGHQPFFQYSNGYSNPGNHLGLPDSITIPKGPSGFVPDYANGQAVLDDRSDLLNEFISNPRLFERDWILGMKNMQDHVVEFCGASQKSSEFIQNTVLPRGSRPQIDQVFNEVTPNAIQLMMDPYGNYAVQKLFEVATQPQKKALANTMKGRVLELSQHKTACRVVQTALTYVLVDQQAELVRELEPHIDGLIKHEHANYVFQKVIALGQHTGFIMDYMKGRVCDLSTDDTAYLVVQTVLQEGTEADKATVMNELHNGVERLAVHRKGNFVVQAVLTHGKPEDRSGIIRLILSQFSTFSMDMYGSRVVEACIKTATAGERRQIIDEVMAPGNDGRRPLQDLMAHGFGNYVIKNLLKKLKELLDHDWHAVSEEASRLLPWLSRSGVDSRIIRGFESVLDTTAGNAANMMSNPTPPGSNSPPSPGSRAGFPMPGSYTGFLMHGSRSRPPSSDSITGPPPPSGSGTLPLSPGSRTAFPMPGSSTGLLMHGSRSRPPSSGSITEPLSSGSGALPLSPSWRPELPMFGSRTGVPMPALHSRTPSSGSSMLTPSPGSSTGLPMPRPPVGHPATHRPSSAGGPRIPAIAPTIPPHGAGAVDDDLAHFETMGFMRDLARPFLEE